MSKKKEDVNPFFEKALPSNPDAERGVIGGILAKPELYDEVCGIVSADDFRDPIAADCFKAIKRCVEKSEDINVVTVYIMLNQANSPVTSIQLSDLMHNSPITGTVGLAEKVKELSERRAIMHSAIVLFESAQNPATEIKDSANTAAKIIDNILAGRSVSGRQDIRSIVAEMIQSAERGDSIRTILTPYEQLNFITGGMHSGEMITLAGRPGTGKTALALNCAVSAMFAGNRVGIFSLEMSQRSLAERMCAATMSINAQVFRTRNFSHVDIELIRSFQKHADQMTAKVFDSPRIDPDVMRAECRKWKRSMGLDLVVIDYLQLVQSASSRKESNREREVAEISRAVKQLAIELDIPVLLLAQLNRSVENREDKTPRLSDLRESGSIEQDSDMVWFLTPWDTSKADLPVVDVKLSVAKSRSSSTGSLNLQYVRRFLRFDEVA